MFKRRMKQMQKARLALICAFVIIAIGFAAYGVYIYRFNRLERCCDADAPSDFFTVTISPRTGQTDSWIKRVEENGETVSYYGTIYDVEIANTSEYTISDWSLVLDMPRDCFLNNAWCGTLNVHQHAGGDEIVQNINLRDYNADELTLDFRIEDPDLMIPMAAGDYIEYMPDLASSEYPIASAGDSQLTQVVFGMIYYTADPEMLAFTDYSVRYCLRQSFTHGWVFDCLAGATALWGVLLIVYATAQWNVRRASQRFQLDERIIDQSIGVFTHFFEAKDIYTTGHSQRVAAYSRMIAEKLGFSENECRQVYYIGLMHDCGKCYIPDDILKKPGALTADEYQVIKSHTVKGAEMLEHFTAIEHIRDGVRYHHERYDGRGYPDGLSGESIPLISRIICISDSFDAMNSRRCYRDMLSQEHILSELKNGSGTQFDPKLVPIFISLISEGRIRFRDTAQTADAAPGAPAQPTA